MNNTMLNKLAKIPDNTVLTLFLLAGLISLSACTQESEQQVMPSKVQAVKLVEVTDSPNSTIYTFPAQVSAVKTVDVSFEVKGRLLSNNLQTGTLVKQGDVLAKLDPTPFNQSVQEAKARLLQAKRNLDRILATYEKNLVSQSEMDSAKTAYELAEIALQRAEQDLSYTILHSPFDAQISERLVDNNSYVTAGQIIARVQDISRYYFIINVSERIVSGHKTGSPISASAVIISAPNKQFELKYIEHDTQPDPITQTYKVVFAAESTSGNLTPGARAIVKVAVGSDTKKAGLLVPFTALVGNNQQGFHVWRFNPRNSQVEAVDVKVEHIQDNYALVLGNLVLGDQVVAAGANKMRAGMLVQAYQVER
ncbi:efflux RND transporter periplasmic adaptor subunit [Paraglaciecola aestuariivivens]